jgi:hypothetical protein
MSREFLLEIIACSTKDCVSGCAYYKISENYDRFASFAALRVSLPASVNDRNISPVLDTTIASLIAIVGRGTVDVITCLAARFVFESSEASVSCSDGLGRLQMNLDLEALPLAGKAGDSSIDEFWKAHPEFDEAVGAITTCSFMTSPLDQAYCLHQVQSLLVKVCGEPSTEPLVLNLWKLVLAKAQSPEIDRIIDSIGKWKVLLSGSFVKAWDYARRAFADTFTVQVS